MRKKLRKSKKERLNVSVSEIIPTVLEMTKTKMSTTALTRIILTYNLIMKSVGSMECRSYLVMPEV